MLFQAPVAIPRRIMALHTSTHPADKSSSATIVRAVLAQFDRDFSGVEIEWIDASELNIAENLSCYADGKLNCAHPDAGPYRCWANVKAQGKDEMPAIYDALSRSDVVIFSTSVRWGSRTALCQRIIERMNTLENRVSSYGEPSPLRGKRLGVIATGLHWRTRDVGRDLHDALAWFGFSTAADGASSLLCWQRTLDMRYEHPDNDRSHVDSWLKTPEGKRAVDNFVRGIVGAQRTAV